MPTKKVSKSKATTKSAKPAKKTTVKKTSVKKSVAKKVTNASFKVGRETTPFKTYKITEQTIYWGVLVVYILLLSLWILKIQVDTLNIVDQIETMINQ